MQSEILPGLYNSCIWYYDSEQRGLLRKID